MVKHGLMANVNSQNEPTKTSDLLDPSKIAPIEGRVESKVGKKIAMQEPAKNGKSNGKNGKSNGKNGGR